MKKYLIIFLVFICGLINAQSSNWQWAKTSVGGGDAGVSFTDSTGNTYLTGYFSGSAITFGTFILNNAGTGSNIYVVKYNSSGNVVWARAASGTGSANDGGLSIFSDDSGNVFVTGYFANTTINFGTITLFNSGGYDFFIAKYDQSGNELWARSAGGSGDDIGYSICANHFGNIFVTGYFRSRTIMFGNVTLINADTSGNSKDIFSVRYDVAGNVVWARSTGGMSDDAGYSVAADAAGNFYETGLYLSLNISFGIYTFTKTDSSSNIFLVKYDTSGIVLWAKSAGGTNLDLGSAVCCDLGENVYLTGRFSSSSVFFGNHFVFNVSAGSSDIFIVKYDKLGNDVWAKSGGGIADDAGYSLSCDRNKNIFLTGSYYSSLMTFGSLNFIPPNANCNPCDPMFLIEMDSVGNILCSANLASGGDDFNSVGVDRLGNAYISGDYYANPFVIGTDTLIPAGPGGETIFLAKYNTCVLHSGVNSIFTASGIKIFPNPNDGKFQLMFNCKDLFKNESSILIYNVLGEKVYESLINAENFHVDVSNQPSGIYFYRINYDSRVESGKIIIQ